MKKLIVSTLAITLALSLLCVSAALGESQYVSIKDIRDTVPEQWTGEYTTKKGETVSIDTPIVVPEVDAVPIVRITWGGHYEGLDESLQTFDNSLNYTNYSCNFSNVQFDFDTRLHNPTIGGRVSYEEASSLFLETLRDAVSALKYRSFECF